LLLLLIARVRLQVSQPAASHPRLCPQTLSFQDAVERHHHRERTVSYYARALALTPAALNRAIVRDLGRTASELIHERVAVEARRLLLDGRLSVKEVAAALGFDDPGHFSRYFKRATGRAPSQFVGATARPRPELSG
jgi:AraC family transcriptional regulator, transcriptional activator of pobA